MNNRWIFPKTLCTVQIETTTLVASSSIGFNTENLKVHMRVVSSSPNKPAI